MRPIDKQDYKKAYKDLYMPGKAPVLIDVPAISFIMVDGAGDPNGPAYEKTIATLYALAFTIKMSKMRGSAPEGYFEYVVPPLEGLWWCDGPFDFNRRDAWRYTSMIRQPEFLDTPLFEWAKSECARKKPEIDVSRARLETFTEGLCVQVMHLGPYATEPETVQKMQEFMRKNGYVDQTGLERKHHEIYLSDPRKTVPDRLKTVLRHPVGR